QRDVYGKTLVELGKKNKDIVVLDADLSGSTRTSFFAKEFPERFFNFGVAEQNMMAASAGLASCGKIVFVSTFAMFATGRAWDQVRNTVCYNNFNIKIVATHAGITVGEDGSSHQALEDIALMRIIPNMKIIVPCDGPQTRDAVIAAADIPGPIYIRLGRSKFNTVEGKEEFQFSKAQILRQGSDVTLIACGLMVNLALEASRRLAEEGIKAGVINLHTIKPFDSDTVIKAVKETRKVVVCEEHSIASGLACCIDEAISNDCSVKIARVGVKNKFGQSGSPEELLQLYGLTTEEIVESVHRLSR
ncbi:MAG: transketolase family protein, partial [Candidatus Omnitrophica bacterium]|nr:transketolase family protein [Candidatus Omnitrophota bacterium]MBU1871498.1 transketolase family protein [Candidatus Omnitrophota bacterium]